MTPFFILGVLIMKGDIIIYFSIMNKKNKKRPDKKIIFYLYTSYFYVIKKMAYNTSSLTHPRDRLPQPATSALDTEPES